MFKRKLWKIVLFEIIGHNQKKIIVHVKQLKLYNGDCSDSDLIDLPACGRSRDSAFMADYEDITVEGRLASSKYPLRLNRKIPRAVLNNDSFFEIQEFFVRNSEVCVLSPIVIE
ncbi:hypothetical protein DERF_000873 [Dermatophagoides farinae]|uniref:Uncharacterized protein n=1 Tax=Dermatophagoides farinae TaxID=6954 RepID=A0A922LAL2_DERFA|nr:hypothetical protein DERF_000873 [Dermatophagoides farinae]